MNCTAKEKPLVTIAIPTFNRRELLERTVKSVLSQTYDNLEVIIADNGSSDGTPAYLDSLTDHRIRKLYGTENIGMVRNWDRCLSAAKGDYFLLMSDDDMLSQEDSIALFVSCLPLQGMHDTAFVFSDVILERADRQTLVSEGKTAGDAIYRPSALIADFFNNRVSVFPCATFFRTRDLVAAGGYGAFSAHLAVDACAWIAISFKYENIRRIGKPLAVYRIHQSLSSSSIETWSHDLTVIRDLVSARGGAMPEAELRMMEQALRASWNRTPLGYIARKLRQDPGYGFTGALKDIYSWRRRVFSGGNAVWLLGRLKERLMS